MNVAAPESLAEGRFRLLEAIGEGGMATVYRAFDLRLQRPRAIKVLSPALARRPPLRKRFLSEAHTMAGLEESRVVRIFDMGEDGDFVYIVMELVDGGSLLDRVRDYGPLPPRMAADATVQICESLQAAHDAGVIHRDIKPHNILLTRSGEIRVTDFGIAQVQTDDGEGMTKTGAVMGTWGFMAPEQRSNAKSVDVRADVYSVGATLYALLTGNTPPELFMADAEPTMLEGIPEELAEVIKRATRYRREERYVSSRAMAESIRALVPLLPEDPEITVPLVPPGPERPVRPMDTMQQFASELAEPSLPAAGTMVPDLVDAPSLAPEAPRPEAAMSASAAAPSAPGPGRPGPLADPASPLAPVDSLVTEPVPKKGPPWALLAGGALALIGVGGIALAVPLFLGRDDPAPVANGAAADPSAAATPGAAAAGSGAEGGRVEVGNGATPPADATGTDGTGTDAAGSGDADGTGAATLSTTPDAGRRPPSGGATASSTPTETAGATGSGAPTTGVGAPRAGATSAAVTSTASTDRASAGGDGVADAGPAPDAAPSIRHTPPGEAKVGETLTFSAGLPGGDWSVKLYYRPASGGPYQEKVMTVSGTVYTTPVRVSDELGAGIAYFIAATKGSTTLRAGSPTSPKRIATAR